MARSASSSTDIRGAEVRRSGAPARAVDSPGQDAGAVLPSALGGEGASRTRAGSRRPSGPRPPSLRRRLVLLFLQWMGVFLALSGVVTAVTLGRFREALVEDRLLFARSVAHHLDGTVVEALRGLERLGNDLADADAAAAAPALRAFRLQSLFRQAVHVVDERGVRIASDPTFAKPPDPAWIDDVAGRGRLVARPVAEGRRLLVGVESFRWRGREAFLVGEADPVGSRLGAQIQDLAPSPGLSIVVVDATAAIVAAPNHAQLFRIAEPADDLARRIRANRSLVAEVDGCAVCPHPERESGRHLVVMVPLRDASWGLVVEQSKGRALALLGPSRFGLVAVTGLLVLMGVVLSRGFTRSVIQPIRELSWRAQRLRVGDLDTPIEIDGDREVQILASTLDEARRRIAVSVAQLRRLNEELEDLVRERTRELEANLEDVRFLHAISALGARERDPDRLVPELLAGFSHRFAVAPVALVATPEPGVRTAVVHPPGAWLPWVDEGHLPPEGWRALELDHLGEKVGTLYFPGGPDRELPVLSALRHEAAAGLHGAFLLARVLAHDGQRRVLVRRLLAAAEEERRRLARELHDEISQLLTVMQLSLERIAGGDVAELDKTSDLLSRTQKEIHRIIYDLRPSLLDDLGLAAAIRWYATTHLARQGIEVGVELDEELELSEEVEITVFRIYQEIVTNILRHARAENVSVQLVREAGRLVLTVEDDGVGFELDEGSDGVGLIGMRERAGLLGGRVEIDSEPGAGTLVRLSIPVAGEEAA